MEPFEDIRIVDLDAERTSWSRVDTTLRTVYLRLSGAAPGVAWVKFFHEERDSRVMARRRGFWIENQYLVLDCLPEEIELFHLPDLQRSLDHANAKYRHFLVEEAERWRELTRLDDQEAQSLAAVRNRLRTSIGEVPAPPPEPQRAPQPQAPAAPRAPLVADDELSAHDRAVAAAARKVVADRPPASLVPREEIDFANFGAPMPEPRAPVPAKSGAKPVEPSIAKDDVAGAHDRAVAAAPRAAVADAAAARAPREEVDLDAFWRGAPDVPVAAAKGAPPVAAKPEASPVATKPSAPPPVAAKPSAPPVAAKPSAPPVAAKPSAPPVAAKPTAPPVAAKPDAPKAAVPAPVDATPTPPPVTPAPAAKEPAETAAKTGPTAPKPVDEQDVESYLAQYRAKVRAAFRPKS